MRILLIMLALITASASHAETVACTDRTVEVQIQKESKESIGKDEHAELLSPHFFQVDVDGDKSADCVAYFSIEGWGGSNAWVTYLSFFKGARDGRQLLTSTVPVDTTAAGFPRTLDFDVAPRVIKGQLVVQTTEWGEDDPHCCPSVVRKARFVLDKSNRLVEVNGVGR